MERILRLISIMILMIGVLSCSGEGTKKTTEETTTLAAKEENEPGAVVRIQKKYKLSERVVQTLNSSIPQWTKRHREVEQAHEEWENTTPRELAKKSDFLRNDLKRKNIFPVNSILEGLRNFYIEIDRARIVHRNKNASVPELYKYISEELEWPERTQQSDVDRLIIANVMFRLSSEEVYNSALLKGHYLNEEQKKVLSQAGL